MRQSCTRVFGCRVSWCSDLHLRLFDIISQKMILRYPASKSVPMNVTIVHAVRRSRTDHVTSSVVTFQNRSRTWLDEQIAITADNQEPFAPKSTPRCGWHLQQRLLILKKNWFKTLAISMDIAKRYGRWPVVAAGGGSPPCQKRWIWGHTGSFGIRSRRRKYTNRPFAVRLDLIQEAATSVWWKRWTKLEIPSATFRSRPMPPGAGSVRRLPAGDGDQARTIRYSRYMVETHQQKITVFPQLFARKWAVSRPLQVSWANVWKWMRLKSVKCWKSLKNRFDRLVMMNSHLADFIEDQYHFSVDTATTGLKKRWSAGEPDWTWSKVLKMRFIDMPTDHTFRGSGQTAWRWTRIRQIRGEKLCVNPCHPSNSEHLRSFPHRRLTSCTQERNNAFEGVGGLKGLHHSTAPVRTKHTRALMAGVSSQEDYSW